MLAWPKPKPPFNPHTHAERAAQIVFEAVARFAQHGRYRSLASAQATIARLLVLQLKRVDADASAALCAALADECRGDGDHGFRENRARLVDAERRARA